MKNKLLVSLFVSVFMQGAVAQSGNTISTSEYYKKVAEQEERVRLAVAGLSPPDKSALERRQHHEDMVTRTPYGIVFYKPTYLLPAYWTHQPYYKIYDGNTPDNQRLNRWEFKGQLSLRMPIEKNIFNTGINFDIAYTQTLFWQFYADSQYFRETDYEPEIRFSKTLAPNWMAAAGVVHQSNGRGGDYERSWNRVYLECIVTGQHWYVSVKPWLLIFRSSSSNLHNPEIADYMGHGRIVIAYRFYRNEFSIMLRNNVESWFKRGAVQLNWSFPIHGYVKGYFQLFSGYGQSLIEYNHYTNAVGLGVSLSNWM